MGAPSSMDGRTRRALQPVWDRSPHSVLIASELRTESGFPSENVVDAIVGATEGFSIVLCDLRTLLETGRSANLVRDKAELITSALPGGK